LVREQHTVQSILRERLTATPARCCATAAVAAFSLDGDHLFTTSAGNIYEHEVAVGSDGTLYNPVIWDRDLGALMELVARDYRDPDGNGREELRNYLRGYLLLHPTVRVSTRIEHIEFPYEDMARVRLQVATMGQGGGGSPVLGISADLQQVELEIVREDGDWRVRRAEHSPAL
jgi:hypothetical protein